MKKKAAFALRDFDGERILQRRYFRELNLPNMTDEEILSGTVAHSDNSLEELQKKIATLETLQKKISDYQSHISRHVKRLEKYLRIIEQKGIADTNADIAALREKYTKALTLIFAYADAVWSNENPYNEDKVTVLFGTKISVTKYLDGIFSGVSDNLRELYKAERYYYRKIFAERLKAARKAAGLTQTALSEKTGIARRNISDYEKMLYEPNLGNLVKFSEELGKPVGWFLGKQ